MDGIANDRTQYGRDDGCLAEPEDVLRSLLIALADNGVSARCDNRPDLSVKVVQMGFCPLNLGEYSRRAGVTHGTLLCRS